MSETPLFLFIDVAVFAIALMALCAIPFMFDLPRLRQTGALLQRLSRSFRKAAAAAMTTDH